MQRGQGGGRQAAPARHRLHATTLRLSLQLLDHISGVEPIAVVVLAGAA
jgi:hypothetical protein